MALGFPPHTERLGAQMTRNPRVQSGWRPEAPPGHQGAAEEQSPKGSCLPQHPGGPKWKGA